VNAQRIVFVKEIDKLSPRLKLALANGEKFDQVIVDFYRGGSPIRLTLKDVQLYSIQPLPSGQEKHPAEVVSLIAIAPVPQK
jgi:type VI protein secretion system component Hcp